MHYICCGYFWSTRKLNKWGDIKSKTQKIYMVQCLAYVRMIQKIKLHYSIIITVKSFLFFLAICLQIFLAIMHYGLSIYNTIFWYSKLLIFSYSDRFQPLIDNLIRSLHLSPSQSWSRFFSFFLPPLYLVRAYFF